MAGQRVLGWLLAIGVGVSGALVAAPASAAEGDPPPPTVRVAGRPVETSLRLAGASPSGVAVLQGTAQGDWGDALNSTVFTGIEGSELTARPMIKPINTYEETPLLLGVAGNQLGWAETVPGSYGQTNGWYLHRMEVESGTDVIDAPAATPAAFTGDSWFTHKPLERATAPAGTHLPLLRHVAGTGAGGKNGEMNIVKLLDAAEGTVDLAADGESVLLALADPPLPGPYEEDTAPPGNRQYQVLLINLWDGESRTVVEPTTDVITSVALGPSTIAWDSQADGQSRRINSASRYDGEPVADSYVETDPDARSVDLVAGSGGVGYLVFGPVEEDTFPVPPAKEVELRVVSGETATTTKLPDYSSGLAAVDDRFLTATGGAKNVAGVYSISPGDVPVRTATVPQATRPFVEIDLAGSTLYSIDRTASSDGHHSVWQTAISGKETLTAGPTRRLGVNGIGLDEYVHAYNDREIAFSAGRGLVRGPSGDRSWQILDRGKVTSTVESKNEWQTQHPAISGPYAIVDTTVFKPNGDEVYELPVSNYYGGSAELFGSTIVYALDPNYDEETNSYEARTWVDDVENPDPQMLTTDTDCGYQPAQVAVWGELAAWASCDSLSITVRNLRTGADRKVENPFGGGYSVNGLQLSEGVLFWSNWVEDPAQQFGGHLVNLADPTAARVDLLGDWEGAAIDDHLIARNLDGRQGAEVQRLPFTTPYRPRLIGKVAGARFTAGTDTWKPKFDFSKPMVDVRMTVADSSGATVRTLAGTAADGSIRDLAWDGRDRNGRKVAPGVYHWRLLGQAADGDGALIGKTGGGVISGQVRVQS